MISFLRVLQALEIPSVAIIDYDANDQDRAKILGQITQLATTTIELPHVPLWGDFEGIMGKIATYRKMLALLDELLAHNYRRALLDNLLKLGLSGHTREQVREARSQNHDLIALSTPLTSEAHRSKVLNLEIRQVLVNFGLRKIKGPYAGRVLAQSLGGRVPPEYALAIERAVEIAKAITGSEE